MPCCGLSEYRVKVPWKFTVAGAIVFWGAFSALLVLGIIFCWTRRGRSLLAIQRQFLVSLWGEAMRDRESIQSRWSCRISGYVLPWSRPLAKLIYRRPEIPLGVLGGLAIAALVVTVYGIRSILVRG